MKLSFVVRVPERDKGFEEFEAKLKRLKELGYDGVELAIKDPLSCGVQRVREIVMNSGLAVSSVDTGAGYIQNGPSLNSTNELMRNVAVGKIKEYVKIASILKSEYVTISTIRGLFGDDPKTRQARIASFIKSLKECNISALKHGTTLLLEPLCKEEMDFINSAGNALDFLLEHRLHDVGVLLDVFYMNHEDHSISGGIIETATCGFLKHIHIADDNRLAPGQGNLDFEKIFSALEEFRYDGFITVEVIHPSNPPFEKTATQSINFLRKYIKNARR